MPPAETISFTLSPDMLRAVRESVEAGEYASTSAVMQEAVRLWQRQRQEDAERFDVIRARVRRSLDDPRPDLTVKDVRDHIDALAAQAEADSRPVWPPILSQG